VQRSRYREADAAVAALIETRLKTAAEYRRTLFDDLARAEQKAAGLSHDVIKAEQRTRLQLLGNGAANPPNNYMVAFLKLHEHPRSAPSLNSTRYAAGDDSTEWPSWRSRGVAY
jgi:hypothetical protein